VYSSDDAKRFLSFQVAVLTWFIEASVDADIIHCHDHHTGLIPFMMTQCMDYDRLKGIPTLLTIHNAQYQGWMDYSNLSSIPAFNASSAGLLDWNKTINSLAAGIKCAWRITTVSKTYMAEMMEHANGLENLLSAERQKCSGILNGIDTEVWNTLTDPDLVKNYQSTSVQSGKKANKDWLCKKFGLDHKLPLMVFIGRLVYEKGADLFADIFERSLDSIPISILLLGSGDKEVESDLQNLKANHKGRFNAHIGYDEPLAHKMYAGADYLFMPSRVEPCGLNQLYAMRYGTIPIVSGVGGLKDTVTDIDDNGYGIRLGAVSTTDALHAIKRAALFYQEEKNFRKTRRSIMKLDHSWDESAKQYIALYASLKN
jgi:starch synthase